MMIGIGLDLVEIDRMKHILLRQENSFLEMVLSEREQEALRQFVSLRRKAEWLAGRVAAKEAASKALGTGLTGKIMPSKLEIIAGRTGKPELTSLQEIWSNWQPRIRAHVTITHTRHTAAAVVILEQMEDALTSFARKGDARGFAAGGDFHGAFDANSHSL